MSTPDAIDPIMDEVYSVRQRLSAKYDNDPAKLAAAARERMQKDFVSGARKYANLPIARTTTAA